MIFTEKRIELLDRLGNYMLEENPEWQEAQQQATYSNAWFNKEEVEFAIKNIALNYLRKEKLDAWISRYQLPKAQKKVGIVMAGNIPLVGFHDFICGFLSGHQICLKLSSKDQVLPAHLIEKLKEWEPETAEQVFIAENLKNCDAYIATGSNNTSRYFEQYFSKYPNIIRKNRTSVAILNGNESEEDLKALATDIFSYFGLGCRNVTQICVPENYDFGKLLEVFKSYDFLMNEHKYKNNYDYHLAVYLLNKIPYQTNGSLLLVQNDLPFSAVSVLHYRLYREQDLLVQELKSGGDVQTIVGNGFTPFGQAQKPGLSDFADGVDTMEFLCNLS